MSDEELIAALDGLLFYQQFMVAVYLCHHNPTTVLKMQPWIEANASAVAAYTHLHGSAEEEYK